MLAHIAKLTGGKVRSSLDGVFDDRPRTRFAYEDVTRALVIAAAALVLATVASRRLSLPLPSLAKLRALRGTGKAPSPPQAPEVAPALGALLAAKGTSKVPRRTDASANDRTPAAPVSPPARAAETSVARAPQPRKDPEVLEAPRATQAQSTAELLAAKRKKRRER
jgi:hypothetical protein